MLESGCCDPCFIDEEMGLEIPPHIAKGDRPDQETVWHSVDPFLSPGFLTSHHGNIIFFSFITVWQISEMFRSRPVLWFVTFGSTFCFSIPTTLPCTQKPSSSSITLRAWLELLWEPSPWTSTKVSFLMPLGLGAGPRADSPAPEHSSWVTGEIA